MALKNQLLAVFDDPYLFKLKNEYTGYATSSTMDLIKHLYEHYAFISPSNMVVNDERLRVSYNAEDPLESIIERLNDCADFATADGEPVSETQLVCIAYGLVAKTGQYQEDCRS